MYMIKSKAGLVRWFEAHDGVGSVADMAQAFEVPEHTVRRIARGWGLPRVGASFAFTVESGAALMEALDEASAAAEWADNEGDSDEGDSDEDDSDEGDSDEDDSDEDDSDEDDSDEDDSDEDDSDEDDEDD